MLERCAKRDIDSFKSHTLGEEFPDRDDIYRIDDDTCQVAGCNYSCEFRFTVENGKVVSVTREDRGNCQFET